MVSLRFRGDFMPACVCTWEQTTRACLVWSWYPIINGSWLEGDADQLGSVLGAWGLMVKPLTKSRQAFEGSAFGGNHIYRAHRSKRLSVAVKCEAAVKVCGGQD